MITPWGDADAIEELGDRGILFASTPSHGGVYVPDEVRAEWPEPFRSWVSDIHGWTGWYEEDCEIAIPILMSELEFDRDGAIATLRHYYPELYDAYVVIQQERIAALERELETLKSETGRL